MNFYTEKSTRLIYDVKLFDDFVMVRPASPDFHSNVVRMDHNSFMRDFEEFCGLHSDIRAFMNSRESVIIGDDDEEKNEE